MNVGGDRKLPADGAIQIAFDRYLLPSSITRQTIGILDGANQPLAADLAPIVQYDPIARTVTLRPPKLPWLTEGQPYKLVLASPDGSETGGVRAIDRAKLFRDQELAFAFFVGPATGQPIEPAVSFCRDVLPIFVGKCSSPVCHGSGDRAASSLVLDTSAGVAATALGRRVAQGANVGALPSGAAAGPVFGTDMPLVDPGSPGNSWLLYKLELARPPVVDAGPKPVIACSAGVREPATPFRFAPLVPQAQTAADEIERAILSDYVLGREMPFPSARVTSWAQQPLTFEERQIIRLWIQGLKDNEVPPECGGCGFVETPAPGPVPEAGPTDAGGDAGADVDAGDAADQ